MAAKTDEEDRAELIEHYRKLRTETEAEEGSFKEISAKLAHIARVLKHLGDDGKPSAPAKKRTIL